MPVRARLPLVTAPHVLVAMSRHPRIADGDQLLTRAGPLRANSPSGKSVSSPNPKNISLLRLVETALWIPTVPPHRGAYRDRHGRGEGCGGRGSVRRAT